MNHYNTKHRVTISTTETPIEGNHKAGDIVEHNVQTHLLEFFERNKDGYYTKVLLERDFIIDLYNQIEWIEKSKIEKPYKEILF